MSEPYLAEIKLISWNYPPKGWAFCNGQLLPINQNQAVFALLGTTYGGDGRTTFALPDLRGRAPIHFNNQFVQGQSGGESSHTLSVPELAAHSHVVSANSAAANTGFTNANTWAPVSGSNIFGTTPNAAMDTSVVTATGGSQPHENTQPYLVLNFVIALVGIFPSRN
jgi:microcystin-dependent protein